MIITILAMVFVLVVLVFFHELGHFLAARSVGMRVERFYIGFNVFGLGFKKKIGETEYGLGLLPLGGYVKVAGVIDESMDTELSGAPWEFQSKNTVQKLWFMSAGVLMNLLLAVVVFAGLTLYNGVMESEDNATVGSLAPDYPAVIAGIQTGDRIISIDDQTVETWKGMTNIIHGRPDEDLNVSWERDGVQYRESIRTVPTEIWEDGDLKRVGMIGIGPVVRLREAGVIESVGSGISLTAGWFVITYKSLVMIVTGKASLKEVGGPILIAQLAGESAQSGFATLLGLLAIISVNLAFINVLPIPALDGGHIAIALVEAAMRRPLSLKVRLAFQQAGMLLLLTLLVFIIYNDIMRIID